MRILIVAPMLPDSDGVGAIPILLHAQLTGLCERNEVTLVTAIGDEPGEEEAARKLSGAGFDLLTADRRRPRTVAKRWRRRLRLATAWLRGTPWRAAWFGEPGIQPILDRLAAEDEFDVAVVEDSAIAGFRLPPGAVSVLTEHEVLRPRRIEWHPGRPSQWPGWAWRELDWRRRHRFQRAAWKRFDRVLAFSRRDAEAIAELQPEVADRVRVSPFGLNLPPLADPAGEDADTLFFAGNFTHQPNRDAAEWLAGEIVPALRRLRPQARLRLVGSSPPPSILSLAGPGVEVTADAPSIEPYLGAATVVAAPVRTGGGMRMKVLQALAAGKAVVTTSRGTEGFDCFDEPPPLAVADDGEGFAAAVAELLADPGRRHELGQRARAFAESHFAPAAWADRLEAVYEEAREGREKAGARG
jgi:glycosyltransferase involved in cell wall biosynthesis